MKTKGFLVACLLLLALPCCKAIANALVSYVETWADGPTGRVKKVGETRGGEQAGDWSFSYESGAKLAAGGYENDHPIGAWSYWYENGNLKSQGSYDDEGGRTGPWTYYHDNGVPSSRGAFANDREHGPWTFTSRTGQPTHRGSYESGSKIGLWTFWHGNGNKSAEGCFAEDEPCGAWRLWTANGEMSVARYDVPEGIELPYEAWPDGTPRRRGMLRRGKRVATWITWHRNGEQRLVCAFEDDRPTGTWTSYRADGGLLAEGSVKGSILDDWRLWTGTSSAPQARTPLPQVPPSPTADWSDAAVADREPPATVFATWLAEMRGPVQNPSPVAPASARPASVQVVEALDDDPRPAPDPQPTWTEREIAELDKWVRIYSTGLAKAASLMSRYGGGGHRAAGATKKSNRDELVHHPCPFDELQSVDGNPVRLSDYRGKKKVLVVILRGYFGQVCMYCVAQTKALAQYRDRLRELGLEVLVVYPGPKKNERAFRALYESEFGGEPPPYRVFYDPGLSLVEQLEIGGGNIAYPTTLLIDENGIVQYAYTGKHKADRPATEDLIKLIEKLKDT